MLNHRQKMRSTFQRYIPLERQLPTLTHSMEQLLGRGRRGPGCLASLILGIHRTFHQNLRRLRLVAVTRPQMPWGGTTGLMLLLPLSFPTPILLMEIMCVSLLLWVGSL